MSELWKSYKGFKVAYGEDPEKHNTRGHAWKQQNIYCGFCHWGPDYSQQRCVLCDITRSVLLHPGPNNIRYSGFSGPHGCSYDCDFDCPITDKEKIKEICKSKATKTPL